MQTLKKHYSAVLDLGVEFADRLASGETLSSGATLTVKSASYGTVGQLTIGSVAISGTKVVGRYTGGTAGEQVAANTPLWRTVYTIEAKVVTSSGETESELVELVVYDSVEKTS